MGVHRYFPGLVLALLLSATSFAAPQTGPPTAPPPVHPPTPFHLIPLPPLPVLTPGQLKLLELEGRFAADVAQGGGKAFASWFADDGVALSNGEAAVRGRARIAATATWDPKIYSLSWVAEGADMSPAQDMGYTWGHYQGVSDAKTTHQTVKTGRYITVWKKQPDGQWKVALDASADLPPQSSPLL